MRIAVISPHLDDALFSVGEHMLSRPDDEFTIVCPCGESPAEEPDHSKYETLLTEHYQVCARGRWGYSLGHFADDGARSRGNGVGMGDMKDGHRLENWLTETLRWPRGDGSYGDVYDQYWAPFGIRHPDHTVVVEACMAIATSSWWWYEELPYRVDSPEWAAIAHHRIVDTFGGMTRQGFGPGCAQPDLLEAKRRLCHGYASQIGPDVERCLYAPERLWAAT